MVSGPPGSGKTTLAGQLARRLNPSAHLETDLLFNAIQSGFIDPWKPASHHQNTVIVTTAANAARNLAEGGYHTIVDGVVFDWAMEIYREICGHLELHRAILVPPVETVLARGPVRNREREPDAEAYRQLHAQFMAEAEPGSLIEPGERTAAELADALLAQLGIEYRAVE